MKDSPYFEQIRLLLRVLPHAAAESCFALKGGTAIKARPWSALQQALSTAYLDRV